MALKNNVLKEYLLLPSGFLAKFSLFFTMMRMIRQGKAQLAVPFLCCLTLLGSFQAPVLELCAETFYYTLDSLPASLSLGAPGTCVLEQRHRQTVAWTDLPPLHGLHSREVDLPAQSPYLSQPAEGSRNWN